MEKLNHWIKPSSQLHLSGNRFSVDYLITARNEDDAREKAFDITVEQTVEFPVECVPDQILEQKMLGIIESFKKVNAETFKINISFPIEAATSELTQLLNVLYGNISIKPGIKIIDIHLHPKMQESFKGPKFGIKKIREMLEVENSPLVCSALKPMGLSSEDLSLMALMFAKGGVHLIKDDHGLSNQSFSDFKSRISSVTKALKNYPKTIYAPNITAPINELMDRAYFAKECGAKALLISPGLSGFDSIKALSEDSKINLPIVAHPAFLGSFVTSSTNGFNHKTLFGKMMRISGADVSIYPNFGGRFSFSKEECLEIVKGCTEEFLNFQSIFPCPGGGMNFSNVPMMKEVYGKDVIYLMGGGLVKRSSDLEKNTRELIELILKN